MRMPILWALVQAIQCPLKIVKIRFFALNDGCLRLMQVLIVQKVVKKCNLNVKMMNWPIHVRNNLSEHTNHLSFNNGNEGLVIQCPAFIEIPRQ